MSFQTLFFFFPLLGKQTFSKILEQCFQKAYQVTYLLLQAKSGNIWKTLGKKPSAPLPLLLQSLLAFHNVTTVHTYINI